LLSDFIQIQTAFPLQNRNQLISGRAWKHQRAMAERASGARAMGPAGMLSKVTIESFTTTVTMRARAGAREVRVVCKPHGMHPTDTVERSLELCQSLAI
jgi:hypothetical protein